MGCLGLGFGAAEWHMAKGLGSLAHGLWSTAEGAWGLGFWGLLGFVSLRA